MLKKFFFVLVFCITVCNVFAQNTVVQDGIVYTLDANTHTASVTGHTNDLAAEITILVKITEGGIDYAVTSIGKDAFYECATLKSVTIPGSIKTIGQSAFNRCTSLSTINLFNGIEDFGKGAFNKCIGITSLTIPESVKNIGTSAFGLCVNLITVTIPENVETIGKWAFVYVNNIVYNGSLTDEDNWGAYSLNGYIEGDFIYSDDTKKDLRRYFGKDSKVTIPNGVTSIGRAAFSKEECESKETSVIIPESVTSIGDYAFFDNGITSLVIPKNVTSIGEYAFQANDNLKSVYFNNDPEKLEIGIQSFEKKTQCFVSPSTFDIWEEIFKKEYNAVVCMDGVEFEKDGIVYILATDGSAMVLTHTVELPTEIVIPATITKGDATFNVTTIAKEAFKECENLTSVIIPKGIKKIGNSAFSNCHLTTAIIPEGVTSIGEEAFRINPLMTTLFIPESLKNIGDRAFDYVSNLDVWWYASPDLFKGYFHDPQQIHVPAETVESYNEKYGDKYTIVGDIKRMSDEAITIPAQTYTGTALTPVVKDGDETLVLGEDYTITLPDGGCKDVGEYKVTLKGNKRYYKSAEKTFVINPAPVTVTAEDQTKTFGDADPTLTAKVEGLVNNESAALITYTLTRSTGENVGEYVITATGDAKQGNYSIKFVEGKLTVTPKSLTSDGITVAAIPAQTYTGNALEPAITVKDGNTLLEKDKDYTVKYADNTNAGTANVTITGKGNYSGETTATFTINKADNPDNPDNPGTPVSEIAGSPLVKVWSFDKTIFIESAPDTKYTIIDLNGRIIKSATTKSTKEEICTLKSGVYIVVIGNASYKVSL